jgi:hypothetical protein
MRLTDDELDNLMYRCDRAIGKLREERLSRSNATEMIGATMSLMNRLHQDKYARQMARKALIDEAIDDSML